MSEQSQLKRELIEAALASTKATQSLLEAQLADLDEQDDRWATLQDNPFGSAREFREHVASGRLKIRRGRRGRLEALWKDCEAAKREAVSRKLKPANDSLPSVDVGGNQLGDLIAKGLVRNG
jgi:hypothetical protein